MNLNNLNDAIIELRKHREAMRIFMLKSLELESDLFNLLTEFERKYGEDDEN